MNIFEVLGPVMIGPSSSHTAGAVRIGRTAHKLLGEDISRADITLSGSFASTGKGHGTDKALIAGLMDMKTDDDRIPDSFVMAQEKGMEFSFANRELKGAHPNTAVLELTGVSGKKMVITGESVGGGKIRISSIDGVNLTFTGEYNTLIIRNWDVPGNVVLVSSELVKHRINIANMQLYRNKEEGYAVMIIECDQTIHQSVADELLGKEGIIQVTIFNREED